jgi:hypothetical protein
LRWHETLHHLQRLFDSSILMLWLKIVIEFLSITEVQGSGQERLVCDISKLL